MGRTDISPLNYEEMPYMDLGLVDPTVICQWNKFERKILGLKIVGVENVDVELKYINV